MSLEKSHITFLMPSAGWGGIERVNVHYSNELAKLGHKVEILLSRTENLPYTELLDPRIRVRSLGARHKLTAIPKVARYLKNHRPDWLITAKDHGAKVGLAAKFLARSTTPVVLGIHSTLGISVTRASRRLAIRFLYRKADGILAVSKGVADDLRGTFGLPSSRIRVVHNPIVTREIFDQAKESPGHPWLVPGRTFSTIVACGRLGRPKDFPTLIRAFQEAREKKACRLIILGEGPKRPELEAQVREAGLGKEIDLPGFTANPYAFFSRADLFVLSSAWEGFGNVLVEALALGTPAVSTDCQSGPREILQEGNLGHLTPVGDASELAKAILSTLYHPPPATTLQTATEPFMANTATQNLLEALKEFNFPRPNAPPNKNKGQP